MLAIGTLGLWQQISRLVGLESQGKRVKRYAMRKRMEDYRDPILKESLVLEDSLLI
jgi:hypothetical protein